MVPKSAAAPLCRNFVRNQGWRLSRVRACPRSWDDGCENGISKLYKIHSCRQVTMGKTLQTGRAFLLGFFTAINKSSGLRHFQQHQNRTGSHGAAVAAVFSYIVRGRLGCSWDHSLLPFLTLNKKASPMNVWTSFDKWCNIILWSEAKLASLNSSHLGVFEVSELA